MKDTFLHMDKLLFKPRYRKELIGFKRGNQDRTQNLLSQIASLAAGPELDMDVLTGTGTGGTVNNSLPD